MGDKLSRTILQIMVDNPRPLRFRQIEAHVVLEGIEVPTSEVQRALRQLVEKGMLQQREDFRYEMAESIEIPPIDLGKVARHLEKIRQQLAEELRRIEEAKYVPAELLAQRVGG